MNAFIEDLISGKDLRWKKWSGAALRHLDLRGVVLASSTFIDWEFEGVDLRGSVWAGACLDRVQFINCDLRGANFTCIHGRGVEFTGCRLRGLTILRSDLCSTRVKDSLSGRRILGQVQRLDSTAVFL